MFQYMDSDRRKRISLQTIGCRLNQYETEKMGAQLYPYGFRRAGKGEAADLYIINTCTVTHRADADNRALIRGIARKNPNAAIVVAGCYVDSDVQAVAEMDGVDVVLRNNEKSDIASILPRRLPELFDREPDKGCTSQVAEFSNHNRAWLKVSDGCNQWCSFCIIPSVRGRLRNRPPGEIIDEVNGLVARGFYEVVLTGVHLGHYKNRKSEPQVKNLAALCLMILAETDIGRIRISSIEPQTVREDLIDVLANSAGRMCSHLHMPLQSGSSRILRLMRRPYDQKTYIKRVKSVREALPEIIIGADVIVGFPGETEEDFDRTRNLCGSGLLDYLHVFSYSDRRGTTASALAGKQPPEVIRERNRILTRVSEGIKESAYRRQVDKTLEVIAEKKSIPDGGYTAVAGNFVRVKLPASCPGGRKPYRVNVKAAHKSYVEGKLLS